MEVKNEKKLIYKALRQAIANMRLEDDFYAFDFKKIEEIKNKVLKMGVKNEDMGGLFNTRDECFKK